MHGNGYKTAILMQDISAALIRVHVHGMSERTFIICMVDEE
jgi:hypothetical protein